MRANISLLKGFCWVTGTGVGGVAVLCGFFSLFMAAPALVALLPVITGFNGAVSGYNLADKTREYSGLWGGYLLIAPLFCGAGVLLLFLLLPQIFMVEWLQIIAFSAAFSLLAAFGGLCFGSWVAKKTVQKSGKRAALPSQDDEDRNNN